MDVSENTLNYKHALCYLYIQQLDNNISMSFWLIVIKKNLAKSTNVQPGSIEKSKGRCLSKKNLTSLIKQASIRCSKLGAFGKGWDEGSTKKNWSTPAPD